MASLSLSIPDSVFQRLIQVAKARNTTPEELAISTLNELAYQKDTSIANPLTEKTTRRLEEFDSWVKEIRSKDCHYPEGHSVDVSRESIYEGRGE